jgi:hypothetical protein
VKEAEETRRLVTQRDSIVLGLAVLGVVWDTHLAARAERSRYWVQTVEGPVPTPAAGPLVYG